VLGRALALVAIAGLLGFAGLFGIGATYPAHHTASGYIVVAAPPERVYDRIADPSQYPAWRSDVTRVQLAAGDRWIETAAGGTLPYRFGRMLRPSRLQTIVDSTTLPFSGTWTFDLHPSIGGTRVTITERGDVFFNYPPVRETVDATLTEVARCTREGIRINTFMLDATTYLKGFVEKLTQMNRGRAFFTTPETLGSFVLVDFIEQKRAMRGARHLRGA